MKGITIDYDVVWLIYLPFLLPIFLVCITPLWILTLLLGMAIGLKLATETFIILIAISTKAIFSIRNIT